MQPTLASIIMIAFATATLADEKNDPAPPKTHAVNLSPGEPGSKLAPRYSPKGSQLKSNNDAVLGAGNWWELRGQAPKAAGMRTIGDFAWADGKAWKLQLEGTRGRSAKLVAFDAGLTEAEDLLKRDRMREDRIAVRAAKPVPFRKDVDATLKEAADKKAALFIKFETDWCMPCKEMTALVFTARDVADAAAGLTCLVVDGDDRKDLTEKHKVKGYPTGIMLDAEGKEIARYTGYQSVKEMTAFFKRIKK